MIFNRDPIQGLVDYVNDIKPYHTKILDVNVQNLLQDDALVLVSDSLHMHVHMTLTDAMQVNVTESEFLFIPAELILQDTANVVASDPTNVVGWNYSIDIPFTITDVNTITNRFTIAGDYTGYFSASSKFTVKDSTGNDTWLSYKYLVLSSALNMFGDTEIEVVGIVDSNDLVIVAGIPDPTVDGTIIYTQAWNNAGWNTSTPFVPIIDVTASTVTVFGNMAQFIKAGDYVDVIDSSNNNGMYEVAVVDITTLSGYTIVTLIDPLIGAGPLLPHYTSYPPSLPLSLDGNKGNITIKRPFMVGAFPVGTPVTDEAVQVTIGESLSIVIDGWDGGGWGLGVYDDNLVSRFMIDGVDQLNKKFTILGDRSTSFPPAMTFNVVSSVGDPEQLPAPISNNGIYTTVSSVYNVLTNTTDVEVVEPIPSSYPDGMIMFSNSGIDYEGWPSA